MKNTGERGFFTVSTVLILPIYHLLRVDFAPATHQVYNCRRKAGFCSINYGVSFPLTQKTEVNGEGAHSIYQYLRSQTPGDEEFDESGALQKEDYDMLESFNIQWNFTKLLIDRKGDVVHRFPPTVKPKAIESVVEQLSNATV